MSELLLELFSEEIPAFMQKTAEEAYLNIFTKIFEEQEIFAKAQVFSGARRITIHVTHLPQSILPQEIEIKGPAVEAPEAAIQGFCKAHNIDKLHLSTKLINNHLYYFFIKQIAEKDIKEVLPEIIVAAINRYNWSKSMYWGDYKIKWIRPLRNILCIFDGEILPLKFGHLTANNITYGHRLKGNKAVTINNFAEYKSKLSENDVVLERLERQEMIKVGLQEIANLHNLSLKEDERLVEEVTGLAEFPIVMIGKVPDKFLKLPREVLISSMRTHQKYFCLFDSKGNFAPYFLFVANGKFSDSELVVKGNEKVLAARLADALYFYKQDLSKSLASQLSKVERVTFHTKLGNLKQKTERLLAICNHLAPQNKSLHLAAKLCKSDLVSEMVGEFPELQGIMGYYYAMYEELGEEVQLNSESFRQDEFKGEPAQRIIIREHRRIQKNSLVSSFMNDAVAEAIRDHYKPQGPSDNVPTGNAALLAIADKLDSLVGLMLAGEAPSGSGDPYALRRQTLGIIRIILENKLQINIVELINFAAGLYKDLSNRDNNLINSFFEERAKFYFKNQYDGLLINAVLDLKTENDLIVINLKLDALQKFLVSDEGKELLTAYKRANNILGDKRIGGEIDINIFSSKYEKELFSLITNLSDHIMNSVTNKDFTKTLSLLASLLTPIADFFDNVMVNDEDPKIANNRLLLLQATCDLFHKVAKFDLL